jgi:hypothetical protein
MADVKLYPGETLLKEGEVSSRIKDAGWYARGKAFLTNQRIVVHKRSIWTQMALGALLSYAIKGNFYFDIPLTSIQSIYRGSVALSKNVFCVQTKDGKEYMLVANFKTWFTAVTDALKIYHQLNVVETATDRWTVQA